MQLRKPGQPVAKCSKRRHSLAPNGVNTISTMSSHFDIHPLTVCDAAVAAMRFTSHRARRSGRVSD